MQIYVQKNGEQFGPYSLEQISALLTSGGLSLTDMGWHAGIQGWLPLEQIMCGFGRVAPSSMHTQQPSGNNPNQHPTNYVVLPWRQKASLINTLVAIGIFSSIGSTVFLGQTQEAAMGQTELHVWAIFILIGGLAPFFSLAGCLLAIFGNVYHDQELADGTLQPLRKTTKVAAAFISILICYNLVNFALSIIKLL